MAYRLKAPFKKSKNFKIWVKDLVALMTPPGDKVENEWNDNPIGPVQLSTKIMPFTGKRYKHRTNGWHVCKEFHDDCVQRTACKLYPTIRGPVNPGPNARLTKHNVQQMLAAFGGDTELLFAASMAANQLVSTSLVRGLCGQLNGGADFSKCVIKYNGAPLMVMGDMSGTAPVPGADVRISVGSGGRAEIDCYSVWPHARNTFGMTSTGVTVTVGDLGVDTVTFHAHLVLKSTRTAVSVNRRPSYVRVQLRKFGTSGSIFSSSASPEDLDDLIEVIDI